MAYQAKKKDLTYLLTKNLKIRKNNKKLNYIKVRPFFIKREKNLLAKSLSYQKMLKYILYFKYCY